MTSNGETCEVTFEERNCWLEFGVYKLGAIANIVNTYFHNQIDTF